MLYKFVILLLAIFFFSTTVNAQSCKCDVYHKKIYSLYNNKKIGLQVCGQELDKFKADRIIAEFYISNCEADSTVDNQMHNEGDAFLLRPLVNGFSVILLNLKDEDEEKQSGELEEVFYRIDKSRLSITKKMVAAKPLIKYLKNFKEYQKIK